MEVDSGQDLEHRVGLRSRLARLGPETMIKLLRHWIHKYPMEGSETVFPNLESLVQKHGIRKIANMAVTRWWPSLSRDQTAQLDIWAVLNGSSNVQWVASRCLDSAGRETLLNVDSESIQAELSKSFKRLYGIHVRVEERSDAPMYIVRIQLFDISGDSVSNSHKPFYLAVSLGHSVLFHSPQKDTHSLLIVQSFMRLQSNLKALERINHKPTSSLERLNYAFGDPSMNTIGFGVWSIYAMEERLEPSPLIDPSSHSLRTKLIKRELPMEELKRKQELAMIKFKGSRSGVRRQVECLNKRRSERLYSITDSGIEMAEVSKYDSLMPVKRVTFNYIDSETSAKIRINLSGKDVFGGLHELCDKEWMDAETAPDWLCGDYGERSGIIENNSFTPDQTGGLI